MNEDNARAWLSDHLHVSRETMEKLEALRDLVVKENGHQNLVAKGSIPDFWTRHIVDSAQLMRFAPEASASWIDLGTGAGFPGLVIALLHEGPVTLVEERRLRAEFLERCTRELGISDHTAVRCSKLERLSPAPFHVISARAFAPLEKLLTISHAFSTPSTRWILPKGRNAATELDAIGTSWQGTFRLESSVTDDEASIIVADAVQPRSKGRGGR